MSENKLKNTPDFGSDKITIRNAAIEDAGELLSIYAHYVKNTGITFEYEVPSADEFSRRIHGTLSKYPYLVAESGEGILGYAYASSFKDRAAYAWSVETSIYIRKGCHGRGTGTLLYQALENILARQNILNLNACIAYPNPESIAFHENLGYRTVAHFTKCGFKAGRWYDMVWMEKMLGCHPDTPQPFIPFPDLQESDFDI